MTAFDGRGRSGLRFLPWLAAAVAAAVALAATAVAIRPTPFVPPSRLFFDAAFSVRLALLRAGDGADVVVFGNSRTRSAVSPMDVAGTDRIVVRSLAAPGGFPAFYEAAFDLAFGAGIAPAVAIVGVSPRDLDDADRRKYDAAGDLRGSSGFRLAGLPYLQPIVSAEAFIVDLVAAVLPALSERERVLAALLPDSIGANIGALEGAPQALLRLWLRRLLAEAGDARPASLEALAARLATMPARVEAVRRWMPEPGAYGMDRWGGEIDAASESGEQRLLRLARVEAQRAAAVLAAESADCARFTMDGVGFGRFLDRLAARGTDVILVQPPAMGLEPCEQRANANGSFAAALERLTRTRPGVRSVIDLMGPEGGAFRQVELFGDADHMIRPGAAAVGRHLAVEVSKYLHARARHPKKPSVP